MAHDHLQEERESLEARSAKRPWHLYHSAKLSRGLSPATVCPAIAHPVVPRLSLVRPLLTCLSLFPCLSISQSLPFGS